MQRTGRAGIMLLTVAIEAGAWLREVMTQWQGQDEVFHG